MYSLVFDTETTGFAKKNYKDPANAKIVQLYAALYDHDPDVSMIKNVNGLLVNTARPVSVLSTVINQNMVVPKEAYNVHGIDRKRMGEIGIAPEAVAEVLAQMVDVADVVVAHNIAFDVPITKHFFYDSGHDSDATMLAEKETFCTMKKLTPMMALSPKKNNDYRWPKLPEAYKYFYDRDFDGAAHDASSDAIAAADIYFALLHTYTQSPAQRI